jgi:hypothetical protein
VTSWQTPVAETTQLHSPIGLRLLDELRNEGPIGTTEASLDIQESGGTWRETDIKALTTASGIVTYPGLEFHADVTGKPPRQYRVRLSAEFYVPVYLRNADGIVFTAHPYNHTHPPQVVVGLPADTFLTPAPNYPFAGHVPVLRGVVLDAHGEAVPYAVVTQAAKERVLTDARGTFALPLRWVQAGVLTAIDAVDERTNRVGTIQIKLPDALGKSQTIPIS